MTLRFVVCSLLAAFAILSFPVCDSVSPEACSAFPIDGDPRKIEGRVAERDTRPWIVLVWVSCKEGGSDLPVKDSLRTCEGALIRERWVLTAADCFPCGAASSVVIDVGLHNSNIRTEVANERKVERIGVDKIFFPAENEARTESHIHSIALLRLSEAVTNSSRVISLISCEGRDVTGESLVGRIGFSSGWGATPSLSSLDPKPLHDAHVCLWPASICVQANGEDTNSFCAGAQDYHLLMPLSGNPGNSTQSDHVLVPAVDVEAESCFVEKGSPLVVGEPSSPETEEGDGPVCEWKVLGVLVFGMQCSEDEEEAQAPGFYANVCKYHDWIENSIQRENAHEDTFGECSSLPQPPPNGYLCSPDGRQKPGELQFCCHRGYQLQGSPTVVCDQDTGTWMPTVPECLPVECPSLPIPNNGQTTPTNCSGSSYQDTCWFSCQEGYRLTGRTLLTCGEGGRWSDQAPNCQGVAQTVHYTKGIVVAGFFLVPPPVVTCGPPPHSGNLHVQFTSTDYNSTATYSCKACHHLISAETETDTSSRQSLVRYCDATGSWNGPEPVCQAIRCPPLVPPPNVFISHSVLTCGSKVRFRCGRGFNLIEAMESECLESGQWSNPAPMCGSISCPAPAIEGSNYKQSNRSYSYGTEIEVTCDHCRVLKDGDGKLTCSDTGEWDNPLPSCQWTTCPLPKLLDHGEISPLGQLYFCGTTVRFECNEGFVLEGSEASSCLINGTWSREFPSCKEVICPEINVPNGIVSQAVNESKLGATANISCDPCFSLQGASVLNCLEPGEWDGPIPNCKPISCPALQPLKHGTVEPGLHVNGCQDTVYFSCDLGYNIEGPLAITCEEDGRWSNEQPVCEIVKCPSLSPPPLHTHICHKATPPPSIYGSTIHYCCDEGYRLGAGHVGVVSCTNLGNWNDTVPTCEAVTCEAPHQTDHTSILREDGNATADTDAPLAPNHFSYSTRLTFSCDSGYTLIGDDVITCGGDGGWSRPIPFCQVTECTYTCSPPVSPEHGRVTNIIEDGISVNNSGGGVKLGSTAVFLCDPPYHLHGSGSRECLANGIWKGTKPVCLPFDQPRGRLIYRDSTNNALWHGTETAHLAAMSSLYLACQTHMEDTGLAKPITKIAGPPLNHSGLRVFEYGNPARSMQIAMRPMTPEAGLTMAGTYLCRVVSPTNETLLLSWTLTVHVYETLCPTQHSPLNGALQTAGTIPGSCLHYTCNKGHRLLGSNDRICLGNGTWSSPEPVCVSTTNTTCGTPPIGGFASVAPPPSNGHDYRTGNTVAYSCALTHRLTGNRLRVCLGRNVWSGERPICVSKNARQ